jgi:hypothetical protein
MLTAQARTMARELAERPKRWAEDCSAPFTQRAHDLPVRLEERR